MGKSLAFVNKGIIAALMAVMLMAVFASGAAEIGLSAETLSVNEKPTKGFSTSFSVTNNGTVNLSGLTVALTSADLTNFNTSLTPSSFSLNVNQTQIITVSGTIPRSINTRLSPFKGTITVGNAQASRSLSLQVTAASQLDFDNVKAEVDGKTKSVDDGDSVKDVKPGTKLIIRGDVRNLFTDNDDITIEDVTVTVIIENIDDGDDLEEEDDVGDIDADEKESFKVEFEIPDDVDQDEFDITIEAEGDDENGAKHQVELKDVTIDVEKDKHDILITKAVVSPTKVSCTRSISMNIDLKNQGRSDEDEVVLRIENANLAIALEDTAVPEIEEGTGDDTELSKSYSFKIADDVSPGTYPISIRAFYETDVLSDIKTADVAVEECRQAGTSVPPFQEEDEPVVVVAPEESSDDEEPLDVISEPLDETTETAAFGLSTPVLIGIASLLGVGVIVIIVLVVVLVGMRKKE